MPFAHIGLPAGWHSKTKSPIHSPKGSVDLRTISENFGVPSVDDPDPFGVLALEQAGLQIKEAGSKSRPTSETFEFRPSPTSPLFRHSFQSIDGVSKRTSKRDSRRSNGSVDQGTQTADLPSPSEERDSIWSGHTRHGSHGGSNFGIEDKSIEAWTASVGGATHHFHTEPLYGGADFEQGHEAVSPRTSLHRPMRSLTLSTARPPVLEDLEEAEPAEEPASMELELDISSPQSNAQSSRSAPARQMNNSEEFLEAEPEPIIAQVVQASPTVKVVQSVMSPTVVRAKLVTIRSRPAPAVPARNPLRQRRVRAINAEGGSDHLDVDSSRDESSSGYSPSPTRSAFDESPNPWSEQTSLPDIEKSGASSKRTSIDVPLIKEEIKAPARESVDPQPRESIEPADADRPDKPAQEEAVSPVDAPVAEPISGPVFSHVKGASSAETKKLEIAAETPSAPETSTEPSDSHHSLSSTSEAPSVLEAKTSAPAEDEPTPILTQEETPPAPAEEAKPQESKMETAASSPVASSPLQDMIRNSLMEPDPEDEASDAGSVSDYGEVHKPTHVTIEKPKDDIEDDEFHSIPATPFNDAAASGIEVPRMQALSYAS